MRNKTLKTTLALFGVLTVSVNVAYGGENPQDLMRRCKELQQQCWELHDEIRAAQMRNEALLSGNPQGYYAQKVGELQAKIERLIGGRVVSAHPPVGNPQDIIGRCKELQQQCWESHDKTRATQMRIEASLSGNPQEYYGERVGELQDRIERLTADRGGARQVPVPSPSPSSPTPGIVQPRLGEGQPSTDGSAMVGVPPPPPKGAPPPPPKRLAPPPPETGKGEASARPDASTLLAGMAGLRKRDSEKPAPAAKPLTTRPEDLAEAAKAAAAKRAARAAAGTLQMGSLSTNGSPAATIPPSKFVSLRPVLPDQSPVAPVPQAPSAVPQGMGGVPASASAPVLQAETPPSVAPVQKASSPAVPAQGAGGVSVAEDSPGSIRARVAAFTPASPAPAVKPGGPGAAKHQRFGGDVMAKAPPNLQAQPRVTIEAWKSHDRVVEERRQLAQYSLDIKADPDFNEWTAVYNDTDLLPESFEALKERYAEFQRDPQQAKAVSTLREFWSLEKGEAFESQQAPVVQQPEAAPDYYEWLEWIQATDADPDKVPIEDYRRRKVEGRLYQPK